MFKRPIEDKDEGSMVFFLMMGSSLLVAIEDPVLGGTHADGFGIRGGHVSDGMLEVSALA